MDELGLFEAALSYHMSSLNIRRHLDSPKGHGYCQGLTVRDQHNNRVERISIAEYGMACNKCFASSLLKAGLHEYSFRVLQDEAMDAMTALGLEESGDYVLALTILATIARRQGKLEKSLSYFVDALQRLGTADMPFPQYRHLRWSTWAVRTPWSGNSS